MFNLSNLLITIGIATGVASNTTPICDTKNETVVIDYTEELQLVSYSYTTYSYLNLPIPPSDYVVPQYIADYEVVTKYRSTSSFLNIYGTKYETKNYDTDTNNGFIENYNYIANNYDRYWKYTTTTMLVLQITTYNYNVGTKITIRNTLNVGNTSTSDGTTTFTVNNRRFLKQVYTTTQDWSGYINKQLQIHGAENIRSDIEDVNNNFYYVKEQTLTNIINVASDQGYVQNDETELHLEPKTTNYVVIEYIPLASETITDNQGTRTNQDEQIIVLPDNTGITQSNYTVTGSNVIPDNGGYEVIDIPGIMWQILTMPFAFVSQAFNLTLFPGTPYQVNISNLFLSIIAIMAFIGIVSLLLRIKG